MAKSMGACLVAVLLVCAFLSSTASAQEQLQGRTRETKDVVYTEEVWQVTDHTGARTLHFRSTIRSKRGDFAAVQVVGEAMWPGATKLATYVVERFNCSIVSVFGSSPAYYTGSTLTSEINSDFIWHFPDKLGYQFNFGVKSYHFYPQFVMHQLVEL